ncbi:MAG: alpha/beta fold hydrolase [Microthrixaceae bacterium]|nr:alpha/beta fold hydrolase [Microthrixaceae bacterium]
MSPAVSAVAGLHRCGVDPWVVDSGEPAHEEGGLQRGLQDHLDAISESIDHVRADTGRRPYLVGYSQGGMFAYEVAVFRGNEGIAGIVTLGSPVDLKAMKPAGIPFEALVPAVEFLSNQVVGTRSLPSWASSTGFELLDPAGSLRKRVDFVLKLHDRDALASHEKRRRFLNGEGWVAWPGPSLLDMMVGLTRHNRFMTGGYEIDGHLYTLRGSEPAGAHGLGIRRCDRPSVVGEGVGTRGAALRGRRVRPAGGSLRVGGRIGGGGRDLAGGR